MVRLCTLWGDRSMKALAVALLALLVPAVALADGGPGATAITLAAPDAAQLGQIIKVKARLADDAGNPIAGAKISFTNPGTFFLGTTSDAVVDQVTTGKDGVAELEYQVRSSGQLGFRAEFRGNDRYASSQASAQIKVGGGSEQLYRQQAGVDIPGLDAPPFVVPQQQDAMGMAQSAAPKTGFASLWPAISFWPLGLVLLIVWSLYATAIVQTWRIVRAGAQPSVAVPAASQGQTLAAGSGRGWMGGPGRSDYHISPDGADE